MKSIFLSDQLFALQRLEEIMLDITRAGDVICRSSLYEDAFSLLWKRCVGDSLFQVKGDELMWKLGITRQIFNLML